MDNETEVMDASEERAVGVPGEDSVVGVTVALSLIGSTAGIPVLAASAKLQQIRRIALDAPHSANNEPLKLSWDQSPLSIKIGSGPLAYLKGTVVGNIILAAAFALLAKVFTRALSLKPFHGVLIIPVVFFFPGTLYATFTLLFFADGAWESLVVGGVGAVVCLVVVPVVLRQKVFKRRVFSAKVVEVSLGHTEEFFYGDQVWAPRQPNMLFAHSYRLCFDSYRMGAHHWVIVELATEGTLALLAAWDGSSFRRVRDALIAATLLLYLAAVLAVSPYIARADYIIYSFVAALIALSAAVTILCGVFDISAFLPHIPLFVACVILSSKALFDLVVAVFGLRGQVYDIDADESLEEVVLEPRDDHSSSRGFAREGSCSEVLHPLSLGGTMSTEFRHHMTLGGAAPSCVHPLSLGGCGPGIAKAGLWSKDFSSQHFLSGSLNMLLAATPREEGSTPGVYMGGGGGDGGDGLPQGLHEVRSYTPPTDPMLPAILL